MAKYFLNIYSKYDLETHFVYNINKPVVIFCTQLNGFT